MLVRSNAAPVVMLSALVFIGSLAGEPLAQAARAPQTASATSALPARLSDADNAPRLYPATSEANGAAAVEVISSKA